jgi:patatin-like phospholipase/acyl hydrolase
MVFMHYLGAAPMKQPIILALNGGGIRGVIPLGFLMALKEWISGSRGLWEAFDLIMGISVGKRPLLHIIRG